MCRGEWVFLPGADAELAGRKLTAGKTLIRHENNERLFLGLAKKEANIYLVLGQMILECGTLLVSTDELFTFTTNDKLFGSVSMSGKHIDIAWGKLEDALDPNAEIVSANEALAIIPPEIFQTWCKKLKSGVNALKTKSAEELTAQKEKLANAQRELQVAYSFLYLSVCVEARELQVVYSYL